MRDRAAFTVSELLAVVTIVTGVSSAAYVNVKDRAKQTSCLQQQKQLGQALMMYEMTNGKLPAAAFFPGKPKKDKDSIRVIMKGYEKLLLCPSAPEEMTKKGLTFLWNDACSGKTMHRIKKPKDTWLLIEINAVSDKVPAPHPGGYNILCADLQTVKTVKNLPKDLLDALRNKDGEEGSDSKKEEKEPAKKKPEEKKAIEKKAENTASGEAEAAGP